MTPKPNFLFAQAGRLAARALRACGNEVSGTPNIDRLAEQGVVFEHAYCNYPLRAPSRFSTLSGLLPSNEGGVRQWSAVTPGAGALGAAFEAIRVGG